jgi:macrodomain Ter protein organizer (MatP/YcbG family)
MAEGHVLGHVEASIFDSRTRNSMHAQRMGSTMSDAMRTFHTQSSVSKSRKQMSAFQAKRKALMATKVHF